MRQWGAEWKIIKWMDTGWERLWLTCMKDKGCPVNSESIFAQLYICQNSLAKVNLNDGNFNTFPVCQAEKELYIQRMITKWWKSTGHEQTDCTPVCICSTLFPQVQAASVPLLSSVSRKLPAAPIIAWARTGRAMHLPPTHADVFKK